MSTINPISVFVGTIANDRRVYTVDPNITMAELMQKIKESNSTSFEGMVMNLFLHGKKANEEGKLNSTLTELGIVDNDVIFMVLSVQ